MTVNKLVVIALMCTVSACADSPSPLAPLTPVSPSTPTPSATRGVLSCVVVALNAGQPTVTCAGSQPGASAASGPRLGSAGARDVVVGRQNTDVTLAFSNLSFTASSGIFQASVSVQNLLNQPLGTTDGINPAPNQTRVFFVSGPSVTTGSGTITINNPDGTATITAPGQAYYEYTSPIAPKSTSALKTWQFKLSSGVKGFTFAVEIDAPLPAEKSIRRWVVLRQGLTNAALTGLWQRTATDVWAVGINTVLNYNGTTWASVTSPSTGSVNYRAVSGVPGATVASVWIVGDGGAAAHDSASQLLPVKTGSTANLYGVWVAAAGKLYAVGSGGTILHYVLGTWTVMSVPHSAATTTFRAVWGADSAHIWAVGDNGTILFGNGTTWVVETTPTTQSLTGVWGDSPTDVFAVGASGTILRLVSGNWTTQSSGSTANLAAVGGSASTDVWAVGNSGTTLHFSGSAWSVVGPNTGIPLAAVTNGSTTPWAVGANGSLLSCTGSAWQLSLQSGLDFNSVWASSATDVWVSTLGTVLHYDGTNWTNAYVAPADSMTSIRGTAASAESLYTTGSYGNVASYAAAKWTTTAYGVTFYSIWGTSASNVYAVGASGLIGYYNGTSASSFTAPTSANLLGVWGSSATNVFTVASNGTIYHYPGSGTTWSSMASPTTNSLMAVTGSAATDVYAVGASGTIIHYTGSGSWATQTSGTTNNLRGAWADPPQGTYTADAYAVGDAGTVQHSNGASWLAMPTPVTTTLRGIYGTSATNLYVVGDYGVVLLGTQ